MERVVRLRHEARRLMSDRGVEPGSPDSRVEPHPVDDRVDGREGEIIAIMDAPPETSFRRPGLDVALSQDRGGAGIPRRIRDDLRWVGSACSPDPSSEAS